MGTLRPLTHRQQAILEFVCAFSADRGFSPSLREIGQGVGLANISAVRGHVAALQRKGYITKEPDKARSISVVRPPSLISRIKRKLHQMARTDEGVVHRVAYGIVLAAQAGRPFLPEPARACVDEALDRLRGEHGWRFLRRRVQGGHLVLVVEVWPNHSPDLTARRIRAAAEHALRRRGLRRAERLWARGYAVTTDLEQLDEMEQQFLETCR